MSGQEGDNATSVDVEIDPHRRRLGRSQTDFALQAIVHNGAAAASAGGAARTAAAHTPRVIVLIASGAHTPIPRS